MNEAASVGKKAKILILLKLLYTMTDNNNGLTIEEIKVGLAEEGIEAERKSIYSDIDTLNSLDFGIEKRRVMGVTAYHLTGRLFTLSQLKLLVDAIITSKFITKKQSEELTKNNSQNYHRQEGLDQCPQYAEIRPSVSQLDSLFNKLLQ